MERLTKKTNRGYVVENYVECAGTLKRVVDRLAELEDKLESGQLVELIAPLDSELWEIEYPKHRTPKGDICTSLTYKGAKVVKSKYRLSLSNYDMLLKGYYFLTEQEAEARLKELRGE